MREEVNVEGFTVSGLAVNVTQEMLRAEYWLAKSQDTTEVIMTSEEIEKMNKNLAEVNQASCFEAFCNKAVSEGIQKDNHVQYGVTVKRCSLRCQPTEEPAFLSPEDSFFDKRQSSSILLKEPVIRLHTSFDQKWAFILTNYASGWVKNENIAVCESFSKWLELQEEPFIVILENKFRLDTDPSNMAVSELELTMGVKLPLISRADMPKTADGRIPYCCYAVKIPIRDQDGMLGFTVGFIPASYRVSMGYLPYTRKNVLELAFASLGERYGWGGMFDAKDCSQYVMELYRCFGMQLARNTSDQMAMPVETVFLEGLSEEEKKRILDEIPAGSALYFPGHVMIYLGEEEGNYYVISAVGSMNPQGIKGEKVENVHTITVNDLNVRRRNQATWMESLTMIKIFDITGFANIFSIEK